MTSESEQTLRLPSGLLTFQNNGTVSFAAMSGGRNRTQTGSILMGSENA
jgi:hypothetical protein